MAKVFGKSQGRAHFQQLDTRDFGEHSQLSIFMTFENTVTIEDITEPSSWGAQPKVTRGAILRAMRVDDAFYAEFICTGCAAGHPQFKLIKAVDLRPEASAQLLDAGADGVRFILGVGFAVTVGGQIVAAKPTKDEAEKALAAHLGSAAA